jgi:hypothetical protein
VLSRGEVGSGGSPCGESFRLHRWHLGQFLSPEVGSEIPLGVEKRPAEESTGVGGEIIAKDQMQIS